MNPLHDKVAVITGAASGFGRELAIACANEGMRFALTDIARITLDAVKENRFYILPHQKIKSLIEVRMGDILDERSPRKTSR